MLQRKGSFINPQGEPKTQLQPSLPSFKDRGWGGSQQEANERPPISHVRRSCCPSDEALWAGTGHCRSATEKGLLLIYYPRGSLPIEGGV